AGKNKTIMIQNMEKLIDQGVSFSLDDFGTGRSNIDYFVNMPVRTIKFDYTFTRGFFDNEKIKHVLTGMLDIIHKMNLSVVVEGIETKEQMEVMKSMGVEFIQGFYYSRPIPENEFMEFLRQNN
ncbi:MAG: EAL domain-containing protein, partial [Lachnospiraceae bacterium]|nr:EAL domain-containing protein [Lachnospiraceae bacterium]